MFTTSVKFVLTLIKLCVKYNCQQRNSILHTGSKSTYLWFVFEPFFLYQESLKFKQETICNSYNSFANQKIIIILVLTLRYSGKNFPWYTSEEEY